jgi:hypothetical protein
VDQALRTAAKRAFWKLDGRTKRWEVKILAGQRPVIQKDRSKAGRDFLNRCISSTFFAR